MSVGYVWMGKFDLTTDTCGRGNFRMRKEEVADSKIPGYLWTGPKYPLQFQLGVTLGPHWLIPRINQPCDQAVLLPFFSPHRRISRFPPQKSKRVHDCCSDMLWTMLIPWDPS